MHQLNADVISADVEGLFGVVSWKRPPGWRMLTLPLLAMSHASPTDVVAAVQ